MHHRGASGKPWNDGGRFRYTNAVGATAARTFQGTGIRWLGNRFDDAGRAQVTIAGVVDPYGPGRDLPFDWRREGLTSGPHELRLVVLDSKAESSRDRYLNVAGFEVLGPWTKNEVRSLLPTSQGSLPRLARGLTSAQDDLRAQHDHGTQTISTPFVRLNVFVVQNAAELR